MGRVAEVVFALWFKVQLGVWDGADISSVNFPLDTKVIRYLKEYSKHYSHYLVVYSDFCLYCGRL